MYISSRHLVIPSICLSVATWFHIYLKNFRYVAVVFTFGQYKRGQ